MIPENNENITANKWYVLIFLATFLLEAAGNISNEFISKIPINLIEIITIIAINTANTLSIVLVFTPLLLANVVFILVTFNLLNVKYQNAITAINAKNKYNISVLLMLNISPTN